ncbi:MAG: bifunctional molybdenum cofactor biosynthesis protein MoaC/MoaB [Bacteroidetes bacterium]|nr:bifunctional molybdenum cofactor biosynthesis protein MoaC/MoaB [Bacteroidota bacterium]MCB9226929.1 bifunctional molybdenum cofactor biosynthesis protein MoaC/MoaB [Chitinophagales bacterium]
MVDITAKSNTLRQAIATAIVKVSKKETIEAIKNNTVPKGNVLEISKAAGLLGVKQTANLIPDCHPLPIEYTHISYEIKGLEITITMEVKTIYKTGVEVEAMHGVSIVALTMYDMLKPIDKGIEIQNIKLLEKKGGKSDYKYQINKKALKAVVIVCSDTISAGKKEDRAGKAIINKLKESEIEILKYEIIPDEKEIIQSKVETYSEAKADLLIFTGGTGLSPRDVTPESISPLLDREIPGIAEAARNYGQERTPYSMLSRSLAGVKGETLILSLPGSTKGAQESMDALFPQLLHIFNILKGKQHQ